MSEGVVRVGGVGYEWMCAEYGVKVKVDGVVYPSVLHGYYAQWVKPAVRYWFKKCEIGMVRKYAARLCERPPDEWEQVIMMWRVLSGLYRQNRKMRERLLGTVGLDIVDGEWWMDDGFWGMDEKGNGKNWYGHLLKCVREDFRKELNRKKVSE